MMNKQIKKIAKKGLLIILSKLAIPITIIVIIFLLVSFITDIFYIGIKNDEDSKSFFASVGDFIDGIFGNKEIIANAEFPVDGKGFNNITSYYGYRTSPTEGASTFHSRNRYCSQQTDRQTDKESSPIPQ